MKKGFLVCLMIALHTLVFCPVCLSVELEYSTRKNTMKWFEGARFGIFIHVDARADLAPDDGTFNVDIRPSMKRAHEFAMWGDESKPPRIKPWQDWNPEKFDADAWVDLFLEAEAKYCTFITMHMWCLSNFDHPATRFDIMSTPYGKDAAAQLAKAAQGRLPLMWYYNMYPEKHVKGDREKHFNKFLEPGVDNWEEFRKIGIHELVRNVDKYGKVAGIWCDGGGSFSKKPVNDDFCTAMKEAQPWLIFSPRCGHPEVPKDWRVPEQKMAPINWEVPQEMTMPIESDQWFWSRGKVANTKDVEYCTQILVQTATRDANLLLNISPKGDGSIDSYQAEMLRGIGRWLRRYGESIFDTRGGPYKPGIWGGSTRKGNKVYLHFTQLSQSGEYVLPPFPWNILSHKLKNGGKVSVEQTDKALTVKLGPAIACDKSIIDRIVELEIDGDAWELMPNATISEPNRKPIQAVATASSENTYKRPSGKPVTDDAANVTGEAGGHGGWTASEPWSEAGACPNPWLMLDFGKPRPFQEIYLKEFHSRIQEFVVEYKDPNSAAWKAIFTGNRLNHLNYRLAKPVTAQFVRVRFPRTEGGSPQISSFQVYR